MTMEEVLDELCYIISNVRKVQTPGLSSKFQELKLQSDTQGYDFQQLYQAANRIVDAQMFNYKNPFDNHELLTSLLKQITEQDKSYVRTLLIPGAKQRANDNTPTSNKFLEKQLDILFIFLQCIVDIFEKGEESRIDKHILDKARSIDVSKLKGLSKNMVYNIAFCGHDLLGSEITKFIIYIKDSNCALKSEHPGRLYSAKNTMRIYINTPYTLDTLNFISDYAIACLKAGLNFDMKAFDKGNGALNNDRLILYLNYADLEKVVRILEILAIKHPSFKASLGAPLPHCASSNDSFYGICHNGIFTSDENRKNLYSNTKTYNDYIDMLANAAYLRLLGEYALKTCSGKMETPDKEIINAYVYLNDYQSHPKNCNYDYNFLPYGTFSGYSYAQIEQAIKKYIGTTVLDLSDEVIQHFGNSMKLLHNTCQGFPLNEQSNIALDTFYIRNEQQRKKHGKGSSLT